MAKSQSSAHHGAKSAGQAQLPCATPYGVAQRVDSAHELASSPERSPPAQEMPVPRAADEPPAEQIHLQIDQLAAHLRDRQSQLDHREAELNSRTARLESDRRATRLWLDECEAELTLRQQRLLQQEQELAKRQSAAPEGQTPVPQTDTGRRLPRDSAQSSAVEVPEDVESAALIGAGRRRSTDWRRASRFASDTSTKARPD